MTTGAARYSRGQFLMLASDFDAINTTGNAGKTTLEMSDGTNTLKLPVRIGGAIPAVTAIKQGVPGVVEVIVFDLRTDQFTPVSGAQAYNVISSPFTWTAGSPGDWTYWPATLNSGTPWTWAGMVADMGLPALPAAPAWWTPRNFEFQNTPLADAMDRIAAELFLVVGWDWKAGSLNFNGPGVMNAANAKLLKTLLASSSYMGGGKFTQTDFRTPGTINAVFPVINLDAADPYAQKEYSVAYATGSDGAQTQALQIGNQPAAYQSSAVANSADLKTIGNYLAESAFNFMNVDEAAYTFSGIQLFQPDGAIREIVWESSHEGPMTKIFQHNGRDFKQLADEFRTFELPTNQLVDGIGATQTSVSPAGTRYTWTPSGTSPSVTVRLGVTLSDPSGVYGQTQTGGNQSFIQTGAPTTATIAGFNTNAGHFADGQAVVVVNGPEQGLTIPGGVTVHLLPLVEGSSPKPVYYTGTQVGTDSVSGLPIVLIDVPPPLDVALVTDGGYNGSISGSTLTCPSYTYTLKDLSAAANTLATTVTPTWQRPCAVLIGPALHGQIYFNSDGVMQLGVVDEIPDYTYFCVCPPCPTSTICSGFVAPTTCVIDPTSVLAGHCAGLNNLSITISQTSSCTWTGSAFGAYGAVSVSLVCSGGFWTLTVTGASLDGGTYGATFTGMIRSAGNTAPVGSYSCTATGLMGYTSACPGATCAIVLS